MQTIKLADDLFPGLADGSKTVTLRKGYRDIKPGPMMIESTSGELPTVEVDVMEVRFKRMFDLTAEEAAADGFESLDSVIPLMQRFYPDFNENSEITLIYFAMLE
jgi:hypothetical protein